MKRYLILLLIKEVDYQNNNENLSYWQKLKSENINIEENVDKWEQ